MNLVGNSELIFRTYRYLLMCLFGTGSGREKDDLKNVYPEKKGAAAYVEMHVVLWLVRDVEAEMFSGDTVPSGPRIRLVECLFKDRIA